MRKPADARQVRRLMTALGSLSAKPATAYLVGGGTAVLEGWRATTIDVDLYLEPEAEELLRAIPCRKQDLGINVE